MNKRSKPSIDLWLVTLGNADAPCAADLGDADERRRCERILVPARRRQFAFRRRALRYVLGRYLPRYSIEFPPTGKPFVRASTGRAGLDFSASSSGDVCAVCVSGAGETGVDVAAQPLAVDIADVVTRFMPRAAGLAGSGLVPGAIAGGSASYRQHLAVMSWCRLEAYTKLYGRTLHEVLFEDPLGLLPEVFAQGRHHVVAVANLDYVCVVAQCLPFQLANVHQIDFARIIREQV